MQYAIYDIGCLFGFSWEWGVLYREGEVCAGWLLVERRGGGGGCDVIMLCGVRMGGRW